MLFILYVYEVLRGIIIKDRFILPSLMICIIYAYQMHVKLKCVPYYFTQ